LTRSLTSAAWTDEDGRGGRLLEWWSKEEKMGRGGQLLERSISEEETWIGSGSPGRRSGISLSKIRTG
jgi:hypothetical protein